MPISNPLYLNSKLSESKEDWIPISPILFLFKNILLFPIFVFGYIIVLSYILLLFPIITFSKIFTFLPIILFLPINYDAQIEEHLDILFILFIIL